MWNSASEKRKTPREHTADEDKKHEKQRSGSPLGAVLCKYILSAHES